jgi:hypothetical protein
LRRDLGGQAESFGATLHDRDSIAVTPERTTSDTR